MTEFDIFPSKIIREVYGEEIVVSMERNKYRAIYDAARGRFGGMDGQLANMIEER